MRKIRALSTAAAIGATMLLAPLTASATVAPHYSARCEHNRISARENGVPVYNQPDPHSGTVRYIAKNGQVNCIQGLVLSDHRYTQCGVSDGNGYFRVYLDQVVFYTPQACWNDV